MYATDAGIGCETGGEPVGNSRHLFGMDRFSGSGSRAGCGDGWTYRCGSHGVEETASRRITHIDSRLPVRRAATRLGPWGGRAGTVTSVCSRRTWFAWFEHLPPRHASYPLSTGNNIPFFFPMCTRCVRKRFCVSFWATLRAAVRCALRRASPRPTGVACVSRVAPYHRNVSPGACFPRRWLGSRLDRRRDWRWCVFR